jgi:hypothetical protein
MKLKEYMPSYVSHVAFLCKCAACFIEWCVCFLSEDLMPRDIQPLSQREMESVIMNDVLGREYCLTMR